MWNTIRKSLWLKSNCLSHQNQVASDSVHRGNLALQQLSCNACLEENKACKCDQSFESCKRVSAVDERHAEANNSFTHSVINMTGMLIGNFFQTLGVLVRLIQKN